MTEEEKILKQQLEQGSKDLLNKYKTKGLSQNLYNKVIKGVSKAALTIIKRLK